MTYFVDTEEEVPIVHNGEASTIGAELQTRRRATKVDNQGREWYTIPVPVPVVPAAEATAIVPLDFVPRFGQVWNNSGQTVQVWLGARGRVNQIPQKFDFQVDPGGSVAFAWPPDDARAQRLGYNIIGGGTGLTGKVTFVISRIELPFEVGSMLAGTPTVMVPFTGAIVADGAHAHDVTLTIANGSKSLILANDSAAGQIGIDFYTTPELNPETGAPIFPNPLPTSAGTNDGTNTNGPFRVAQGKEYPLDMAIRGILVSNPDGANGADYRVWLVN